MLLKFTLYFIASVTVLGSAIIAPAMGTISEFLSDADPTLVRLIVTMPGLFVIPCCIIASACCMRFGKKNVLLFALALYAIAGCLGGFMSDVYSILATRALVGVGVGLLTPISQSLPADFYTGAEKEEVIARASGSISLGNFLFMPLSGFLASISWRYSFFAYGLIFLILLCSYLFIPKNVGENKQVEDNNKSEDNAPQGIPLSVIFICITMFFCLVTMYLIMSNLAIIIDVRGLGSPTVAGYALATTSICAFLVSYNLPRIKGIFKQYTYTIIPFAFATTYLLIYFANSMAMIFLAQITNAFAVGLLMPSASIAIMQRVKKENVVKAMAIMSSCTFFGSFMSPIIYAYMPAMPNHDGIAADFYTTGLLCAIVTIIVFVATFMKGKKELA